MVQVARLSVEDTCRRCSSSNDHFVHYLPHTIRRRKRRNDRIRTETTTVALRFCQMYAAVVVVTTNPVGNVVAACNVPVQNQIVIPVMRLPEKQASIVIKPNHRKTCMFVRGGRIIGDFSVRQTGNDGDDDEEEGDDLDDNSHESKIHIGDVTTAEDDFVLDDDESLTKSIEIQTHASDTVGLNIPGDSVGNSVILDSFEENRLTGIDDQISNDSDETSEEVLDSKNSLQVKHSTKVAHNETSDNNKEFDGVRRKVESVSQEDATEIRLNSLYRFLLRQGYYGQIVVVAFMLLTEWFSLYVPMLTNFVAWVLVKALPQDGMMDNEYDNNYRRSTKKLSRKERKLQTEYDDTSVTTIATFG
jgi:hypothetical protein